MFKRGKENIHVATVDIDSLQELKIEDMPLGHTTRDRDNKVMIEMSPHHAPYKDDAHLDMEGSLLVKDLADM